MANPQLKVSLRHMTTQKQRAAAKRNIKKAATAARRKRTIAHLPKKTRTALGKQAAKAAQKKRTRSK
jgi:hypothetical protein